MATLKTVTKETKTILKWLGILLGAFLIISTAGNIITTLKEFISPTPKTPPAASFGKLPQLFSTDTVKPKFTYSIDTLSGALPDFADRLNVYRIQDPKPDLLALERVERKVANLGFVDKGTSVSQDSYQWIEKDGLARRLTINIFSSDFLLSSSFLSSPNSQSFFTISDQDDLVPTATEFLESLRLLPDDDIDLAKTQTSFFIVEDSKLIPVTQISQAKIAKVDFFQKDVDKLPIYYPNGSTMSLLIGKKEGKMHVVEGGFLHQIASEKKSSYSIKTAAQAFEELKLGNAYIIAVPQVSTTISIKQIALGYYLGEKRQEYLMPIFVFEGDKGFVAYIEAVRDEWINK